MIGMECCEVCVTPGSRPPVSILASHTIGFIGAGNMAEALTRARAATPEPCWVVALGDCATDGGVFRGSYAVLGGVEAVVPVDLVIPGCPPTPTQILEGLVALIDTHGDQSVFA